MSEDGTVDRGFRIRGRVQGVGFRWWTRKTASGMGVTGAVKNLRDGTVEVRAVGTAEAVARLAEALGRGPSSARVDSVEETRSGLPLRKGEFRIVG